MRVHYKVISLILLCFAIVSGSCNNKNNSNSNLLLLLGGYQGTVPEAPGASVVTQGDKKFILSWAAVTGAAAYEVWFYTDNNSTLAWRSGGDITGTGHSITGLVRDTTYYIWLKAKNKAGTSGFGPVTSKKAVATGMKAEFAADSVTFNMVFVPGGFSFKTGTDDMGTATVDNPYWIGESEVIYELWYKVYHWAVTDCGSGTREDGGALYSFANAGLERNSGTIGAAPVTADLEPVIMISWRDSMIWCNALTEWYNWKNGTSYSCVYYTDAAYTTPIRIVNNSEVRSLNPGEQDNPYVRGDATGFRLPSSVEWELAGRYSGASSDHGMYEYPIGSGNWWTPGNYASGAEAAYSDWSATDAVGWFGNSTVVGTGNTTMVQPVMGKLPNALGLYDMSGNVWEWCFDWHPGFENDCRTRRGASWYAPIDRMQVGFALQAAPSGTFGVFGLRIGMSAL